MCVCAMVLAIWYCVRFVCDGVVDVVDGAVGVILMLSLIFLMMPLLSW